MKTKGVLITDYRGSTEVSEAAYYLQKRNIFLNGEIDSEMADGFLRQMLYLAQESDEKEVNVFINSTGGEVAAGLMIVDLIRAAPMPINLICTGVAASMAAIILACGQKGRRYILPNSRTMIHEVLLAGNLRQSATSLKNMSDSLMQTRDKLNRLLAEATGKKLEQIQEFTSYDNWMSAEESVSFGLVDEIIAEDIFRR